jgi:hypothetical protein
MTLEQTESEACVPNIVARGRSRRLTIGWITLVFGVLATAWFVTSGVDRAWRLWLLLPFWGGAVGIFQAYAHT